MPNLTFDERFSPLGLEHNTLPQLKKAHRQRFVKEFGITENLETKVITHGNPDGLGELKDGAIVIRTIAKITEEQAADLRKRADEKKLQVENHERSS